MTLVGTEGQARLINYFSSIKHDVWGGEKSGGDYEWWYFDALSDDASEAITITFLDDFLHSPIYNQYCEGFSETQSGLSKPAVPAVAFVYYRDGKPVIRSVTTYSRENFEASTENPACRIGDSSFEYLSAPYGSGFAVKIDVALKRGRRLRGTFEWLTIEADLAPVPPASPDGHAWNLVAPRADVTGRITVIDRRGRRTIRKFRGTGYHDHNVFRLRNPALIEEWFWGRAHFSLATAVYYRYREIATGDFVSKLLIVKAGSIESFETDFVIEDVEKRTRFGLRYPENLTITGEGVRLEVRKNAVLDSSMCYLRFQSAMTLEENEKREESQGISEYLPAAPPRNNLLNRLVGKWVRRGAVVR